MKREWKAIGCWWVILVVLIIGLLLFGYLAISPFANQKFLVDSMVADGNLESYTPGIFRIVRGIAIPFSILFVIVLFAVLVSRSKSQELLQVWINWVRREFHQRWVEIKNLCKALKPDRDEYLQLAILFGIIIFGIFFRYAYLWRPMGHDETYTFMAFASRGLKVVLTDYHLPNNHVFHSILVSLFYKLFGDSPAVIRLTAFIAGILIIPATYFVAKIFYDWKIALIAGSIVAALPVLVDYSTTARGYTLIALFSLILVALAAFVKDNQNLIAWILFIIVACLGLYTNPTMIYPVGMAYTWLGLSALVNDINPAYGKKFYLCLLFSAVGIGITVGILYSPIFYFSGLQSLVGNDVIESLGWSDFTQSLLPRINNTWGEWNRSLPSYVSVFALIGLVASLFVPKLPRSRRVPLIIAGFIWIGLALVVQRVAPWPRIWLFLLPFFVIWIVAGLYGLISLIFRNIPKSEFIGNLVLAVMVLLPVTAGIVRTYPQYNEKLISKGEVEQVADFLDTYLEEGDVVVVTSPDTVVLKYYLLRLGISKEFTELVKGKEFSRAIVVVNVAYGQTLGYVLERRSFQDDVLLSSVEEIYRTKRFILYQLGGN
jgi:preprotein translocase subunit Sss1